MDPTDNAVPTDAPEAPIADQPEAPVTEAPETPAAEEPTTPAAPEGDAPESDDESFTDIDPETLPEEAKEPYKRLQADYTRKTQALAERHAELDQAIGFVSDIVSEEANDTQEQVFRILAERLGYDIDDAEGDDAETDTPEAEGDEPDEFRDPRLDPILAEREAEQEAKRQADYEAELDQHETAITDGITAAAKADGIELTEAESDVVFDLVLALPPADDGPDVAGAYKRYQAATQADRDRWVKSKKATLAPGTQGAEETVDFNNEDQRLAFMASRAEAAMRAQAGH